MRTPTLAIIGGGAGGMAAALAASGQGVEIVLCESQARLGRKLLATGNGRCNLSHQGFSDANYHGTHPRFVHAALARHDEADTIAFFESLGLAVTTDERQRYYPATLQAAAVLDVLRLALEEAGVRIRTETRITGISQARNGHFILRHSGGSLHADAVIVATGGEAAPKLGGTRDGYALLESLGHTLIPTAPGIVQLQAAIAPLKAASGLKREMGLSLYAGGRLLAQDQGEILITAYGLSGPPVLQCAGHAVRALAKGLDVEARLNLFPGETAASLEERLLARHAALPQRGAAAFFVGLLPRLFAQCALRAVHLKAGDRLKRADLKALAALLTAWPIAVSGTRGFSEAQVTIGGIDTADFDSESLQSWIVPGLFACGEVLDIDGDCGGYNLQWAWSSGRTAAEYAVQYLTNR